MFNVQTEIRKPGKLIYTSFLDIALNKKRDEPIRILPVQ